MDDLASKTAPGARWRADAARPGGDWLSRLRLAAMAGHMAGDRPAARRGALIDLLADGRPHPGEEIREQLAAELGAGCWGKRPAEALLRDLKALRRGGIRIRYSRRSGSTGYYLAYPPLENAAAPRRSRIDEAWIARVRAMSVAEKNETAFAAAEFALNQKRLILREEQPDWPAEQIDREARRLVFGV